MARTIHTNEKLRSSGVFASTSKITTGMMIDFTYLTLEGESDRYQVMVIDPAKPHPKTNNIQLHGILLGDDVSDDEIIRMLLAMDDYVRPIEEVSWQPLAKLDTDTAYEKFKQFIPNPKEKYRTFLVDKMDNIRQISVRAKNKLITYENTRSYNQAELQDAAGEYFENEYTFSRFPGLAADRESFIGMLRESPVVVLSRTDLINLDNSDVGSVLQSDSPMEDVRKMMADQGRENDLSRILDGIRNRANLPLPIVIQTPNGYYLLGGNSRLSTLAALGYTMPVKQLTYTPRPNEQ
jgi:hypothetical protein